MTPLTVNGTLHRVDADDDTPLLWVLRDHLGLTGTKFGCGTGACGACAVLIDGAAVRSCVLPLDACANASVTTIEGLARDGRLHPVQRAWIEQQVPQCGYCQSGLILAVVALLDANPHPTDADVAGAITNLCRCGTYPRVRAAIRALARDAKARS
jgi:isoquinoline 1-oxidoreductase alpha subunit